MNGTDNRGRALVAWVNKAIDEADIPAESKEGLKSIGFDAIAKGLWRGDISAKWMARGYDMGDIPEMYQWPY